MTEPAPILLWLRRDLRLGDAPALAAAGRTGRPVIPVFICDQSVETLGAAPKWRLGRALAHFASTLEARGARLILRRGAAADVLLSLIEETGAQDVYWMRLYEPAAVARDTAIKAALKARGIGAQSFCGDTLVEPWTVATKTGGPYRVYTPFWRALRSREVPPPEPAPDRLRPPARWPQSATLEAWGLGVALHRGGDVLARHCEIGEDAARARLASFLGERITRYKADRDRPAQPATSGLSAHLATGEIGPRGIWHAAVHAWQAGDVGAETFLKELVWRDFAWHLTWHFPHILQRSWREDWAAFPWKADENAPEVLAWKQACTGVPLVDAGLREMQVTGRMHNRVRMIVASYLTKHMLVDWRIGQRWFEEHLVDWDPASNAMGWQWVAGSGPDAAPYFRIFNPERQRETFDPDATYLRQWIAETQQSPPRAALEYFEAIPRRWGLRATDTYPREPVVSLAEGRARALSAYESFRGAD